MGFVGIEEIFLKVQDLDRAIDFYHNKLGIPLDKRDHHGSASSRRSDALRLYRHGGDLRRGRQEVCRFRVSDARTDRPSGSVQRAGAVYLRSGLERDRSEHTLPLSCSVALTAARPSRLAAAKE